MEKAIVVGKQALQLRIDMYSKHIFDLDSRPRTAAEMARLSRRRAAAPSQQPWMRTHCQYESNVEENNDGRSTDSNP